MEVRAFSDGSDSDGGHAPHPAGSVQARVSAEDLIASLASGEPAAPAAAARSPARPALVELAPGLRMEAATVRAAFEAAKDAARAAGDVLLAEHRRVGEERGVGEVATKVETAALCMLRYGEQLEDFDVLGLQYSEGEAPRPLALEGATVGLGPTWVVGCGCEAEHQFRRRDPGLVVSVALLLGGEPVVAAACDPFAATLYAAVAGSGAPEVNGAPLAPLGAEGDGGEPVVVLTNLRRLDEDPRSEVQEGYAAHALGTLGALMADPEVGAVRMLGSVGTSMLAVLTGRADCYYECGVPLHLVAAGMLLARVAGGCCHMLDVDPKEPKPLEAAGRRVLIARTPRAARAVLRNVCGPLVDAVAEEHHPLAPDLDPAGAAAEQRWSAGDDCAVGIDPAELATILAQSPPPRPPPQRRASWFDTLRRRPPAEQEEPSAPGPPPPARPISRRDREAQKHCTHEPKVPRQPDPTEAMLAAAYGADVGGDPQQFVTLGL